ncbi:MAG: tetratricopeptide repeat protein, partial [Nitrospirae bacterium]|nr:tetratricopeptide repeat protein [Nitrospirota bacterium]
IRKRYEPKIEEAKALTEANPQDLQTRFQLGYLYDIVGRYDEAEIEYRKAVEIDSRHPFPHLNLGHVLKKKGRYRKAIEEYRAAMELGAPDPVGILNNMGSCYNSMQDFPSAEDAFKKAVEVNPKNHYAYVNLAILYETRNETAEAIGILQKAKEVVTDPVALRTIDDFTSKLLRR